MRSSWLPLTTRQWVRNERMYSRPRALRKDPGTLR